MIYLSLLITDIAFPCVSSNCDNIYLFYAKAIWKWSGGPISRYSLEKGIIQCTSWTYLLNFWMWASHHCQLYQKQRWKMTKTNRGLSDYTALLLIQIIQYCNKCLWRVNAEQNKTTPPKKQVIKCIHLMQFAQHIYILFWAKNRFSLIQEAQRPN